MKYKISKKDNKYVITEKDTQLVVYKHEKQYIIDHICGLLNKGSGFLGFTPDFFVIQYEQEIA